MKIEMIIEKIKNSYKGDNIDNSKTRDQILYGTADSECTGIVTTIWANVEVIKKAHSLGANLIICHEALFWNHGDHQEWFRENQIGTFLENKKLLDDYGITVWRCHDYIHSGMLVEDHYIDGIFYGLAKKLGWEDCIINDISNPLLFEIPKITAEQLSHTLISKLKLNGVRIIGDRNTEIKRIKIPFHVFGDANEDIRQMEQEDFDAILPLEMVDYSLAEYIKDASLLGRSKVSISIGHFNMEEPGMEIMADYLLELLGRDIPVTFIQAGDTYDYIVKEKK